jgi:hypothetical protein
MTMGIQSNGLTAESQVWGPAAQVARAAGVYLGLPLARSGIIPGYTIDSFNPDCTLKPGQEPNPMAILGMLTDPDTHQIDLRRARIDWTLVDVRNVAVGGEKIAEVVNGPTDVKGVIALAIEEPAQPDLSQRPPSQLAWAERLKPDVVLSTDLYINDLVPAIFDSDTDFVFEDITPKAEFMAAAQEFLARISVAAMQVFLGNGLHMDFVERVQFLRASLARQGKTQAEIDARVAMFNAIIDDYNAAFAELARPYPNVHIVDLARLADEFIHEGRMVAGHKLTTDHFGGLVSLDDFHPTRTGYALIANEYIAAINQALGTQIPAVDVDAVYAGDPFSPEHLKADGFTCIP